MHRYISNLSTCRSVNSPESAVLLGLRRITLGPSTCCTRSVSVSLTATAGVSVEGAGAGATAAGLACVITVVAAVS